MNNANQIAEFIHPWGLLQDIQLNGEPDNISWRWTTNGIYSSKSAYRIQFAGTFCRFNANAIWSASAEGKHKLFLWLFVQNRILTTDCLLVRQRTCAFIVFMHEKYGT
jgi:hypothetical protein